MRLIILGFLLILFTSCQDGASTQDHEEAFQLHQVALATFDTLTQELESMIPDSLPPEQYQQWQALQDAGADWEANLVEVPGFEHDHHHDHGGGHHHDHGENELQELPAEEMRALQQALLVEVQHLLGEARNLVATTSTP